MPKFVFNPNGEDTRVVPFDDDTLTVGQAPDNHVSVRGEGIADYHLCFERRDELVYVVDLDSGAGTYVDGKLVHRFVLGHRAVIRIGDLEILYLEEPASTLPMVVTTSALARLPNEPTAIQGPTCLKCGSPLHSGQSECPRCGLIQSPGGGPLAPSDLYVSPMQPYARGAGILPMLSFFFALFGPLILGIGWLLGIIFGFISLSLIRQRGGFKRDRSFAIWGIGLGFLWLAIIVAGAAYWVQYRGEQKTQWAMQSSIKDNETDVIYLLKEIAVVEEFLKGTQAIPQETSGSGFATLPQLQTLPNPFLPADQILKETKGYTFTVKAHWGSEFIASAVPQHYGQTGRKTFAIDQRGVLRGADIGGKQPWEYSAELPELELGRSVYLEARERIARELLVEARRLAEEGKFARSRFILQELQRKYVLTETFKNFENVANGIEQLVTNAQAQEALDRVKPLLAAGKRSEALALLKQIVADYPKAMMIGDVKSQIAGIEGELTAERNKLAQTQWAEAVRLDKAGEADAALAAYQTFVGQFPDTAAGQANKGNAEAAIGRIEESKASTLFASLTGLDVRSNAPQVLQIVTKIQGSFPNTPTVKKNLTMLLGLQQQAQSYVLTEEGRQLETAQNYIDATERYDRAIAMNPSLLKDLSKRLEECYFQAGDAYYQTNKLVEAAAAYEKFLRITPTPGRLDHDRLKQIYLSLGEMNFLNKSYTNAVEYLKKGVEFFGNDPKFYRMYGQSWLRQKKYAEALPAYQSLVGLSKDDPQARFERALCLLGSLQEIQTNIVTTLAKVAITNSVIAAGEQRSSTWAEFLMPPTVADKKIQSIQIEVLKDKQFELRLRDTMDRLKAYSAQTSEAAIIREAVRLVNDIQTSGSELNRLARDAKSDISETKFNQAKTQLLSVFSTQQDYFDKIIGEKIAVKQELLGNVDRLKTALETSAADLTAAATVEAYRTAATEMSESLKKKMTLFNGGYGQMKPALETEIKTLDEARALIKLAVSQFKGWAIGWNLNDRIEKFFMVNFSDVSEKKASGEQQIRDSLAVAVPFEKNISL